MDNQPIEIHVTSYENGKKVKSVVVLPTEASREFREIQKRADIADATARSEGLNHQGLCSAWCSEEHDDENSFRCYPQDGECSCGMWKHHVHCRHGYVVQVG